MAIIFGTAIGLFTMMMIVIITSIVCRRKQGQLGTKTSNNCHTFSSLANERRGYKYQEAGSQSDRSAGWRKSNATSCTSPSSALSTPLYDDQMSEVKKSQQCPPQSEKLSQSNERTDPEKAKWLPKSDRQQEVRLSNSSSADVVV